MPADALLSGACDGCCGGPGCPAPAAHAHPCAFLYMLWRCRARRGSVHCVGPHTAADDLGRRTGLGVLPSVRAVNCLGASAGCLPSIGTSARAPPFMLPLPPDTGGGGGILAAASRASSCFSCARVKGGTRGAHDML